MKKLLHCVFSLICCFGMVADVGVLARALNPNGLLGKGRIYFYDRTKSVAKKNLDFQFLELIFQIKLDDFLLTFLKNQKKLSIYSIWRAKKLAKYFSFLVSDSITY